MIAASLVTLALGLSLAQVHQGHAAPPAAQAVEAPAGHGEAAPAGHGAAAGGHGAAGEHGAPGECPVVHDESLGGVMMHHVADTYVLELPGVCAKHGAGGFHWNCDVDLRTMFGTTFAKNSHCSEVNVAGPLVLVASKTPGETPPFLDLTPSKHVVMMWLASALLLLVVFAALRKKALVPKGLYSFIELLVAFVRNELAVPNIGAREADRFLPYLLTAFFFILFLNLFGLLPFAATPTANLSVTVCLALLTFLITQYAAIKSMGVGGYLGHLTGGVPKSLWPLWFIMIPVEFLGLFTKPFALTVRLFANMAAGHFVILALIGLIFALGTPWVALGSVPMALGIFMLELFVAFVQAYIFTMLSSLFIGAAFAHHGHDDGHGHGGEPAADQTHASHVAGATPGHG